MREKGHRRNSSAMQTADFLPPSESVDVHTLITWYYGKIQFELKHNLNYRQLESHEIQIRVVLRPEPRSECIKL